MPCLRIIAPSGPVDPQYIEGACARLRAWGYDVSLGKHVLGRWGRFAATDDERIADFLEAIEDDDISVILCARGGYGLQRIIDRMPDTEKLIIGFSDITALHMMQNVVGLSTLHGLMCKQLSELPDDDESLLAMRRTLAKGQMEYRFPTHNLSRQGDAVGRLVGGNLSVLYGLQATPYGLDALLRRDEQTILFIEDVAERHYHIDRMMQNLRLSGVLSKLSGLIVGQFSDCEEDPGMGESIYETVLRAVKDYEYPVWIDFPAGHTPRNLPLMLGLEGTTMHVTPTESTLWMSAI